MGSYVDRSMLLSEQEKAKGQSHGSSIVAILGMVMIGACSPQPSQYNNADNLVSTDTALDLSASSSNDIRTNEPPPAWTYTSTSDPMSDESTELACVQSSNTIYLASPYGETGARLCLRNSPQFGRDAYVSLNEDGQILCNSYESCGIRIRFDKEPAENWSAVGPSDNSSDMVFIEDRASLERKLRAASTTHVQMEFYQNGNQTFTFNTADLSWKGLSNAKSE